MMIYIAGPFFDEKELEIVRKTEEILLSRGFDIYSPRQHEARGCEVQSQEWSAETFRMDRDAIDRCDRVLVIYHGNYSDSGTAWECGYASAKGKPVVVLHLGESSNLMIHESASANIRFEDLKNYDFELMNKIRYQGKMY